MSDRTDDTNDWRELREFAGVDLASSFVLSWDVVGDSLVLDVDLCLTPEHPFFEKPRPSEGACIRPATLEFPYCDSINTREGNGATAKVAAALRIGRIEGLRRIGDGHYEITGPFGRVAIESERPLLRLKGSMAS